MQNCNKFSKLLFHVEQNPYSYRDEVETSQDLYIWPRR